MDLAWHGEIADRQPALYSIIDAAGLAHGKSMKSYLIMMAVRLLEMQRILKSTGSLYLHCDPTAPHYLKMLMDAIVGPGRFRNEIIWKRTASHGSAKRWGPVHDVILYYARSKGEKWNAVHQAYDQEYIDRFYRYSDAGGKFQSDNLTGAGLRQGDSGEPWRGVDPSARGRHWAVPGLCVKYGATPAMTCQEKLDVLDKNGLIAWPETAGMPRFKRYLSTGQGIPAQDVITDVAIALGKQRTGYPTQKPLALLDRIVRASS